MAAPTHPPTQRRFSRRRLAWPIVLAVVVFFASGQSQVAAPGITGIDKLGHFLVFGLLATLVLRISYREERPWRSFFFAVAVTSFYGLADEFRQSFTPGRSVEVADWVADTLGALLAAALYAFWRPWRRVLEIVPHVPHEAGRDAALPDPVPVAVNEPARRDDAP